MSWVWVPPEVADFSLCKHRQLRVLATGQGERYAVRYQHMLQALEIMMGETLKNEFNTQVR